MIKIQLKFLLYNTLISIVLYFCPVKINSIKIKRLLGALVVVFALSSSFHKLDSTNKKSALPKGIKDTLALPKSLETPMNSAVVTSSSFVYSKLIFEDAVLSEIVFEKAFRGFENLKKAGELSDEAYLLTICDFSKSSNEKRLWVIDTNEGKVLFNSLVAHGKNTGEEFAQQFSNTESSLQSSLGFYITNETYFGENGYSLRLIGMDKGFNDAAEKRAIVMHGADYVSADFALKHKRIGRSWGCNAVPREVAEPLINTIKSNQVLFIYYPDEGYLKSSRWLNS